MKQQLICEQGHRWDVPAGPADATLDAATSCPTCGGAGRATPSNGAYAQTMDFEPRAERGPPSAAPVPGYEILRELGRGGMGVVYLARQSKLGRLVALKMVLSGAHAGERERTRFLAEAGAVAKLRHPNIVQIHEIGEVDGRPYFSLEYVEGGSLAEKLDGTPLPPRDAAKLLVPIARATQAAHDAGIVHRDLKPANILMSPISPMGPIGLIGTPKITDFGLAKQVDSADGPTQTGAILGTPSYMAPEQGSGDSRNVGPAVDVYALGAILYELLTGRPPFRAATPLDTVMQVMRDEPVPPRQLQPKLPRDLETICLKCLQKESRKRYASAGELADELDRFLDNQPIRARPVGSLERGWRWAKRNPRVAVLLTALTVVLVGGFAIVFALWRDAERQRVIAADKERIATEQEAKLREEYTKTRTQEARAKANLLKAIEAVDTMLTRVADERLAYFPQFEDERRKILEDAVRFYDAFLKQEADDPLLRRETARAYARLGHVLQTLGESERAIGAFEQAVRLQEQLLRASPNDAPLRQEMVQALTGAGDSYRMLGDLGRAGARISSARDLAMRLHNDHPGEPGYAVTLAETAGRLAYHFFQSRRLDLADGNFRQAQSHWEALVAAHPEEFSYALKRARAVYDLAYFKQSVSDNVPAESYARTAVSLLEQLRQKSPGRDKEIDPELAKAQLTLASIYVADKNHRDEVDALLKPALAVFERLGRDYPLAPYYQLSLAQALQTSATRKRQTARAAEAEPELTRALEILIKLDRDHPTNFAHGIYLRKAYQERSRLYLAEKKTDAAIADLEAAVKQAREQLRRPNAGAIAHVQLVQLLQEVGTLVGTAGRTADAGKHFDEALEHVRINLANITGATDMMQRLQIARALMLAHAGDHSAATTVVATLNPPPEMPGHLYNIACVYSLSAKAASADAARAADYLKRAGELVRRIHARGYFRLNPQFKHFWEDSDLEALRADPEFRRWLDVNLPEPKKDK